MPACQRCGREAPTRHVGFHQHIGLIVIFLHTRIHGAFCRACVGETFTRAFLITLAAGWWGILSFFLTLFFLPYDLVLYLLTLRSFRDPTDRGGGGRTAIAVASGILPLFLLCIVTPFLALTLGLHGLAALTHDPDADPAIRDHAAVCSGARVPTAPAYDPTDPHVIGFVDTGHGWHVEPALVPESMRADADWSVVACLDPDSEEIIERCPRTAGDRPVTIFRTTYPRLLRILEVRTARELTRTPVVGHDPPPPCPPELTDPTLWRLSGSRVQPSDAAPHVERLRR